MVEITSPSCNLYRIVVLPALSSPSIRIRIGVFLRQRNSALYSDENVTPILASNTSTRRPCAVYV